MTTALPPRGLALVGAAGARLGATRRVPTSPDPLLRLVRQWPEPPLPTPAILGIDDRARRRGRPDSTLLVDWERHRPIALWPDRTAETRAVWLRAHPGVTPLSRERSTEYALAPLWVPQGPHRSSTGGIWSAIGATPSHGCWIGSILAWQPC